MTEHTETKHNPTVWPALTAGLAAAVLMWILWFITHMPAVAAPRWLTLPLLMVALVAAVGFALRGVARPMLTGALAGLVSGLVNLLLLGSKVVVQPSSVDQMEQSANELRPDALVIVLGFLAISAALGAGGSWIGNLSNKTSYNAGSKLTWLRRFSWTAAAAFLPLLVVGGTVTSTESGMAVPDAVTSYGAVSVLFPFSLMAEPRIYFEHTHRLFGTLVGLTTLIWAVLVFAAPTTRTARVLAVAVFLGVCLQGYFGIVRVAENLAWVGAGHGVFAQIVFGAAVALAALVSAPSADRDPQQESSGARPVATGAMHGLICLLIQLSFGALYRHTGSTHALWSHVGFSLIVAGAVAVLGFIAQAVSGPRPIDRLLRATGTWLIVVVGVQFALGWVALWAVHTAERRPVPLADELATAEPVPVLEALVATAHQANGALLVAVTAAALVWGRLARVGEPKRDRRVAKPILPEDEKGTTPA